eukprot:CAMPEP_0113895404 /NCGR_PEP_ID=MMETSP0780_2-20120614/17345_1 /TAXON_ID=652834 /ORGANISM="Palpitomonas bilix" /LENGTH=270 /DNA_ID=CAMNT_0000886233 /DNA_START=21 /DNA_END=836 /DNA_ORIENTATION=- /assembly_acc=CAM_ASM_000599
MAAEGTSDLEDRLEKELHICESGAKRTETAAEPSGNVRASEDEADSESSSPDRERRKSRTMSAADIALAEATKSGAKPDLDFSTKHQLQNAWTWWYDHPDLAEGADWTTCLKKICTVSTVEDFWSLYNHLEPASALPMSGNYSLFKEGITPQWEDEQTRHGGKWILDVQKKVSKEFNLDLDTLWLNGILGVIGESYEPSEDICGIVVSIRKQKKISLWLKSGRNEQAIMTIGKQFKRLLGIPDALPLNFQLHKDSMRRSSSFNNKSRFRV